MTILRAAAALHDTPAGTSDADCCVWDEAVCLLAYDIEELPDEVRALWRIYDPDDDPSTPVPASRVWGPTIAAAEVGIARYILRDRQEPPRSWWAQCQGWRSLRPDGSAGAGDTGHTWKYLAVLPGVGIMLDSTRDTGPRIRWVRWADLEAEFRAGIRVAVLRRPRKVCSESPS